MNTRDFVKTFIRVAIIIILQNMISYSANVADNIMLGIYAQAALSAATIINQLQFIFQQMINGLGEGLVTICARAWGKNDKRIVYKYSCIAVIIGLVTAVVLTFITALFPTQIMMIFTKDPLITSEGLVYLSIIKFTYIPFAVTTILLSALRSMENVNIGLIVSMSTLGINIVLNYLLIYGNMGFPELGVSGAAIATLISRLVEITIVVLYIYKKHKKMLSAISSVSKDMVRNILTISMPIMIVQTAFGLSISVQTAILGHMSSDAIAANSVATNIFQYLKIIAIGSSSATVVVLGKVIGSGELKLFNRYKKMLQYIYLGIGIGICIILNVVKYPLVSIYSLTDNTKSMAVCIITILSIAAIGMAYQMPTNNGIIRAGGDTGYALKVDLISIWLIMYPVTIIALFIFKASPLVVVALLNSDQIFKCIPIFIKANFRYKMKSIE
ncbi:MAG: MATE family efflux transporter [Suipraeoptans sp.]